MTNRAMNPSPARMLEAPKRKPRRPALAIAGLPVVGLGGFFLGDGVSFSFVVDAAEDLSVSGDVGFAAVVPGVYVVRYRSLTEFGCAELQEPEGFPCIVLGRRR